MPSTALPNNKHIGTWPTCVWMPGATVINVVLFQKSILGMIYREI